MILEQLRTRILDRHPGVGIGIRGDKLFVSESPETRWLVAWARRLEGSSLLVELCDLDGTIELCRGLDEAAAMICEGVGIYFEAKGAEAIARAVADPFWSHLQRFAASGPRPGRCDEEDEQLERSYAWLVDRGLPSAWKPIPRESGVLKVDGSVKA